MLGLILISVSTKGPWNDFDDEKWPKWPWRSRSMTSIINTSREYPRMHVWSKFGDSSLKSMTSYRADKPNFLEFWVKMAKMTLKVKANHLHFQYQPRVSQDACLVQIWWFQLKSVTSYRADKVKFTDGHGRTQATTIPLRPERPRGKNAFETIICEMAAILSRRRWVN